jgi:hypothetical protein
MINGSNVKLENGVSLTPLENATIEGIVMEKEN